MSESVAGGGAVKSRGKWPTMVFVALSVFMINGFIYTTFNVLLQTISVELGWTGEERALVATGMATGMTWFIFVSGIALDRFSVKKLIGSFQIIGGILIIMRGVVTGATLYFAVMFLFGVCFAMLSPAHTKLISLWFNQKDIALANGAVTAASPLGQITGNLLTIPIMNALGGWHRIFILQGILYAVIGCATLIFVRERRNIDAELSSAKIQSEEDLGIWKNIKGVAKVPQFWLYVIAHACALGMTNAGGSMAYTILQVDPRWSLAPHQPGIIVSFNNFASMTMYVVAPLLIAKFLAKNYEQNYRRLAIVAGFISGIAMSAGWASYSFAAICICYLISGITFGQVIPVSKVLMMKLPEVSGPRAGTGLGILHTMERLAQVVLTALLGLILAANPENGGRLMAYLCLIYLVTPIMFIFAMQLDKRQAGKKEEAPVT